MKTYRITINGEAFDVHVEEVHPGGMSGGSIPAAPVAPAPVAVAAPVAAPKPVPAPAPQAAPAASAAGSQQIQAPMPGKVLGIKVKVGDSVTSGTALAILEAMKMENDIVAPADGTIASINVSVGDSVNTGDLLITMN